MFYSFNHDALADLATAGAIASTDQARPILTGVLFTFTGDTVTATATDSYALVIITRELVDSDGGDGKILLDSKSLARTVKLLPKGFDVLRLVITGDGRATIDGGDGTPSYPVGVLEGNYPDVRTVITPDSVYNASETSSVHFDPRMLAKFAKVAPWSHKGDITPMHLEIADNSRPIRLTARGTMGMLMPVRVK